MTETTDMTPPSKWDELKRLTIKYWPPVVMILVTTLAWLMYGGDSAPVTPQAVEAPAAPAVVVETPAAPAVDAVEAPTAPAIDVDVNQDGFFAFVGEGNFWLAMTIILAILMIANWASKLMKHPPAKIFDKASKTWTENKDANPAPRFKASIVWLIAGVLMVVVGLWGIYPAFFGENNEISEIFGELGLFGIIAVGAIAITLVVGAVKYMGIAGDTSAYFFMVVWVLLVFFAILYLIGIFLAPDATTLIIEAVKNDAQSAAASIVERGEDGKGPLSLRWEALFDKDTWISIAIVAILTLAPVVVFHQYISKNKLVVLPVALVAMMILFGSIYKILIEYEPAREVIEDVSGALGAASEPFKKLVADTKTVNLQSVAVYRDMSVSLTPYDKLLVVVPMGGYKFCLRATDRWAALYQDKDWVDITNYGTVSYDAMGVNNYFELSPALADGMKAESVTSIDLLVRRQPTNEDCPKNTYR